MPRVTVSIPLYNKEAFITDALHSVRAQSFKDLSVLVIDDGSSDNSVQRVKDFMASFPDLPLELEVNEKNLGVQGNGNKCLELPSSEYIARFDADDLMPAERISKQVAYLDAHETCIQVGGYLKLIGNEEKESSMPLDDAAIKAQMPVFNGISQGTSMFRRSLLKESGLRYDEQGPAIGEDWLLFYKLSRTNTMANLPEVMDIYRIHGQNISSARNDRYYEDIDQVLRYILTDMGLAPTELELKLHYWLRGQFRVAVTEEHVDAFTAWCGQLQEAYERLGLQLKVLEQYRKQAYDKLYFQVDPRNKAAITRIQQYLPMSATARKYLKRKRLKQRLGLS